ncbi:MAG: amino acid--[acyl-carrier-protein] ligase [Hyphomicrobiales bacterium]|nr:amino acid--[acyl-carrier-protein] ligase [Hyphomicrobiales bacterium]MBV8827575.1 amino acid--[acyl-carrier-protein] ligase [Hyphomicrobiales bacterium]MBV9426899.1 amino acid--[acyl-carrier-protein] ligase [Bradyrhizobiaceae bacterium]
MNDAATIGLEVPTRTAGLLEALFRRSGVDGLHARTDRFERVVEGLQTLITQHREKDVEVLRFPPVMSRRNLEKSGYLHSFPHLLGAVCCLHGDETAIRAAVDRPDEKGGWVASLAATDLVLSPAACYPVYPLAAERGPVAGKGLIFDVACDCFRHEPSLNIDRMQSFRMREYVFVGAPGQVNAFRARWIERAQGIAEQLGLSHQLAGASDPFFGRVGKIMAVSQMEQELKLEMLIPVRSADEPTACMSFNCHRDHFGEAWGLRCEDGTVAHTGCVAFGIDRLALALFAQHGLDLVKWPRTVRTALSLNP